jgi:hypothetical protein
MNRVVCGTKVWSLLRTISCKLLAIAEEASLLTVPQYEGEIIVDHQSYMLDHSNSSTTQMMNLSGKEPEDTRGEPLFSKFNDVECSPNNPLEPAQYLLLPGYIFKFALEKKDWGKWSMKSKAADVS